MNKTVTINCCVWRDVHPDPKLQPGWVFEPRTNGKHSQFTRVPCVGELVRWEAEVHRVRFVEHQPHGVANTSPELGDATIYLERVDYPECLNLDRDGR